MPPRRELMAQPACSPRWDCRDVSPPSGMGTPGCVPSPSRALHPPGCASLPQFTPEHAGIGPCGNVPKT